MTKKPTPAIRPEPTKKQTFIQEVRDQGNRWDEGNIILECKLATKMYAESPKVQPPIRKTASKIDPTKKR